MNEILNQISERISKIESENRKSNVGTIIALADAHHAGRPEISPQENFSR